MTIPIHSIKHIKVNYRRYQMLAIVSVTITVVLVTLAMIISLRHASLSRRQLEGLKNQQVSTDHQSSRELKALQEKILDIEKQLVAEKSMVRALQNKNAELQAKLAAALQTAREKPLTRELPESKPDTEPQPGNPAVKPQSRPPAAAPSTGPPLVSSPSPAEKKEDADRTTTPLSSSEPNATAQPESSMKAETAQEQDAAALQGTSQHAPVLSNHLETPPDEKAGTQ